LLDGMFHGSDTVFVRGVTVSRSATLVGFSPTGKKPAVLALLDGGRVVQKVDLSACAEVLTPSSAGWYTRFKGVACSDKLCIFQDDRPENAAVYDISTGRCEQLTLKLDTETVSSLVEEALKHTEIRGTEAAHPEMFVGLPDGSLRRAPASGGSFLVRPPSRLVLHEHVPESVAVAVPFIIVPAAHSASVSPIPITVTALFSADQLSGGGTVGPNVYKVSRLLPPSMDSDLLDYAEECIAGLIGDSNMQGLLEDDAFGSGTLSQVTWFASYEFGGELRYLSTVSVEGRIATLVNAGQSDSTGSAVYKVLSLPCGSVAGARYIAAVSVGSSVAALVRCSSGVQKVVSVLIEGSTGSSTLSVLEMCRVPKELKARWPAAAGQLVGAAGYAGKEPAVQLCRPALMRCA